MPQTTKIESPAERIQVPEAPDLPTLVAMGEWRYACCFVVPQMPRFWFMGFISRGRVGYAKMVIGFGIHLTRRADFRLLRSRTRLSG